MVKLSLILMFFSCLFAQKLTVAVSSNMQLAFEDIVKSFKIKTGIKIDPVYASSGKLTTQIINGAPFDLFLSADMDYPQILFEKNLTRGKPKVYGLGKLIFWSMKPVNLVGATRIAIADPLLAPYGREAKRVLNNLNNGSAEIIYAHNISQVNQYVYTFVADIGITSSSVLHSPFINPKGYSKEISPSLYNPIKQGIIILKTATNKYAETLYAYILSNEGQEIITSYGYYSENDLSAQMVVDKNNRMK